MLLTDARRPARTGPDGALVPMAEQDRSRWNADDIAEGVALITGALPRGPTGPYQLQAAIAAVHDEAPSAEATDWPQIVALYELLLRISDNPVVALNHAVAVAMAQRPAGRAGPARRARRPTTGSPATTGSTRSARTCWSWPATAPAARDAYQAAARRTTNLPQQRYLHARAARLDGDQEARCPDRPG